MHQRLLLPVLLAASHSACTCDGGPSTEEPETLVQAATEASDAGAEDFRPDARARSTDSAEPGSGQGAETNEDGSGEGSSLVRSRSGLQLRPVQLRVPSVARPEVRLSPRQNALRIEGNTIQPQPAETGGEGRQLQRPERLTPVRP